MRRNDLIGRTAVFDPLAFDRRQGTEEPIRTVRGKVEYVNHKHGWFSVKYGKLRTSFTFSEIGKEVQIL